MITDPREGTRLGEVTLERRISHGPLGSVYRGRAGGQAVAVKLYHRDLAPAEAARVTRERDALKRIRHPGVARFLDWGHAPDGAPFLVREWIAGQSLEERFAAAPLPWPWMALWPILASLCESLGAVHAAGVVHRDLKPANLIVPDDGRAAAVLVDLGHSLLLDGERLTERGITVGSAAYLAPEQAAGLALDGAADLYALGVILYRGLTGELPFAADSAAELLVAHQKLPVTRPSLVAPDRQIPPVADDLCLWLLAKRKEARVPSARVLAVVLDAIFVESHKERVA
jgi:serine/threonine-protein kinase